MIPVEADFRLNFLADSSVVQCCDAHVFFKVVARVNNGAGEFSVSVRPKQPLCDGMFHRVAGTLLL